MTVRIADAFRAAQEFDKGGANAGEGALDVPIRRIEFEGGLGLQQALLVHDGLEQLLLGVEIDVERALRHAGGRGRCRSCWRRQSPAARKDRPRAFDDLTALGAVVDILGRYFSWAWAIISVFPAGPEHIILNFHSFRAWPTNLIDRTVRSS
jgi:hypothetical protein